MQTQKFNFGLCYKKEKGAVFSWILAPYTKKNYKICKTNKNKPYIYRTEKLSKIGR